MPKIKRDINCTHPIPLASAPVDETDVVRSAHVACLYRNDDSSVIEIAASLIYPHFTGCEIESSDREYQGIKKSIVTTIVLLLNSPVDYVSMK